MFQSSNYVIPVKGFWGAARIDREIVRPTDSPGRNITLRAISVRCSPAVLKISALFSDPNLPPSVILDEVTIAVDR